MRKCEKERERVCVCECVCMCVCVCVRVLVLRACNKKVCRKIDEKAKLILLL